ncbi:MAG: HNH endonuclease [Desulfobacterales bacterium]|nr:HNH endonuclease [Desulfobacterales bacterium]
MFIKKCALCNVEISENNDSKEHIIPNAIGGKKKVKGFICDLCNIKSGDAWETELAKQLNSLCLLFNIKRDRGAVPSQKFRTTGGKHLILNKDGTFDQVTPGYKEVVNDTGVRIDISDRSYSKLKKRLRGVKRKYPQAPVDEALNDIENHAIIKNKYTHDLIEFNYSFGGDEAGRSIVKSALSLAFDSGINPKDCKDAMNYLLNSKAEACFGFFYERDLIKNRPEKNPFHCVYVKGDPVTQLLLGYVEYFGCQRVVLCLSRSYNDVEFNNQYSLNPITGENLTLDVDLNLTLSEIESAYNYEKLNLEVYKTAVIKIMAMGQAISFQMEKERVFADAVKYAFSECGVVEGEILTSEQQKAMAGLIWKKIEPFVLHNIVTKH